MAPWAMPVPSATGLLLVGIGGFIGSAGRYAVGVWTLQAMGTQRFPWGTFLVNVSGCLLIGVLAGLADRHALFGEQARLFLFTGLLGGFTTFSAFGLETMTLLRRGDLAVAASYVGVSVLLGLVAVWLGMKVATTAG